MQICMLVQPAHCPIPDTVKVIQDFGLETVIDADEKRYMGHSMLVESTEQGFIDWLKNCDGVWQCSSPMIGDWQVFHIKKELAS